MKNGKIVFLLILLTFFCAPRQNSLFGQPGDGKTEHSKNKPAPPKSPASANDSVEKKIKDLESDFKKISKSSSPQFNDKIKELSKEIEDLKKDLAGLSKLDEKAAADKLIQINKKISDTNDELVDLSDQMKPPVDANTNNSAEAKPQPTPNDSNDKDWLSTILNWALFGVFGLIIIGIIGAGIYFLNKRKSREREEIARNFGEIKRKTGSLEQKIKDLTDVSTKLSAQIAAQNNEIRNLKQNFSNSSAAAPSRAAPVNYPIPPSAPPEEPQFPVAVDDYLAKTKSGATPVKFDYKEGMLVPDAEREAGLLVVRDGANGAFYLVPGFGFFQTKSDFTNYFERYYTCARPMGGTVFIRQPATVNQVNGGWQLAQTGELEVR